MNHQERYNDMLHKGSWHDHYGNHNWKAFCYLMSSDTLKGKLNVDEFFRKYEEKDRKELYDAIDTYIEDSPYSSGERVMMRLALFLYANGDYSFSMSNLLRLDNNNHGIAMKAVHIATW